MHKSLYDHDCRNIARLKSCNFTMYNAFHLMLFIFVDILDGLIFMIIGSMSNLFVMSEPNYVPLLILRELYLGPVWQGSSFENTAPEQVLHHEAALRWS